MEENAHHLSDVMAGAVIGMYVRGFAFEYRATWESTWLDASQMQRLMGKYVEEAGLSPATIKALRYSFAGHHLALPVLVGRLHVVELGHGLGRKKLEAFGDDLQSLRAFGEEVVTYLCQKLLDAGAPGLHFYTMNQSGPTLKLWKNLGLERR